MISLVRRDGRPLRIGHRGAAALAAENTLRSFRAARDAGVDLIEFDVLALDGGELVVAHSNDLREVSHGAARGTVRGKRLRELRQICPELPTLDEALEFFADDADDVGVHVDLKSARGAPAVVAALVRFGLADRSFVSSFHFRTVRELSRLGPGVRAGITFPRSVLGITESGRGAPIARGGLGILRRVTPLATPTVLSLSRATALVLHHAVVSPAAVRCAHGRGASVVAWTVDDPGELARVDAAGVDAVVTNDPTIFRSTLRA